MSSSVTPAEVQISRQQLRAFHIAGKGMEHAVPNEPLRPALLDRLPQLPTLESEYPIYVVAGRLPRPLSELLNDIINTHAGTFPILANHLMLIARAFQDAAHGSDCILMGDVVDPALAAVASRTKPLDIDQEQLQKEIGRLRKELAQEGWIVPFSAHAALLLYAAAVEFSRGAARRHFAENLKECRDRLMELLILDDCHSPDASSPESVAAALGMEASAFFSPDILAEALHRPFAALDRMEPERRARCEAALGTLENALVRAEEEPSVYFFAGGGYTPTLNPFHVESRNSQNAFADALDYCEQKLNQMSITLRALRIARLEIQSAYDPSVHDDLLERFDWQAADANELGALPAIAIVEPADRLAEFSLTNFARALRSGFPLQILVEAPGLSAAALNGFMPDFGYLAIAHREAFVLQSSLACVGHLLGGLSAMASSLRTAVAIVSVPSETDTDPAWTETLLTYVSRAFPTYKYDPDIGETWPERFALDSESLKVFHTPVPLASEAGSESVDILTSVHALAVSRRFGRHFRVVPISGWDSEQLELCEYLERYTQRPPLAIPYLWVLDGEGTLQRAVMTRDVVNLCRERSRSWKIYEELAAIRPQTEVNISEAMDESEARKKAATETIHRIVAMLTDVHALPVVHTEMPAVPSVGPAITDEMPPAGDAAMEPAAEPFIDSFLCTSCNDCMKVNPRIFGYDANKQAYIADAGAGTFSELVKAAEGCPAKCIHPGMPRPDDATATAQVLARAAKCC